LRHPVLGWLLQFSDIERIAEIAAAWHRRHAPGLRPGPAGLTVSRHDCGTDDGREPGFSGHGQGLSL
jgi:hypothetical protein